MLRTLLANLQLNYKTIYEAGPEWCGTEYEVFYTKIVGNHEISDMPFDVHNPGDKMNNVVAEGPYMDYRRALKELMSNINLVVLVITRLDYAMDVKQKNINQEEKDLIEDRFFLRLHSRKLQIKYDMGRMQIWRKIREITERIASLIQISTVQYEDCMKMLEWEEKE
jgi:hypothetical protein